MLTRLPEGWHKRKIGSFASRVKRQNSEGEDLEPLSITKDQGVILQRLKYHKRIATAPERYVIAKDGDFAFDPMSLYYGAIGRVEGIGRGLISPDYVTFEVDESINHDFLHQLLRWPKMNSQYELLSETSNSYGKRRRLYWSILVDFPLHCPPLPEQRKIAEILGSVDEAIRATEAVIEQTRRVKEGLLQELLTKGIGQTRFKKTPIGEIPEGWEVKRLGDIAKVERGRFSHRPRNAPHLYGGRYPFVQTGDVAAAERITAYRQTLNEAGKATSKLFPANTILIGIVGANVGEAAITTFEVACPDSIIAIRPDSVSTEWLFQAATTWKPFLQNQSTQNARQNINLETLRPMLIGVPPIEEQEKVAAVTTSFSQSLETLRENLRALETAKQGLLQDLLTGKVRVSV